MELSDKIIEMRIAELPHYDRKYIERILPVGTNFLLELGKIARKESNLPSRARMIVQAVTRN